MWQVYFAQSRIPNAERYKIGIDGNNNLRSTSLELERAARSDYPTIDRASFNARKTCVQATVTTLHVYNNN